MPLSLSRIVFVRGLLIAVVCGSLPFASVQAQTPAVSAPAIQAAKPTEADIQSYLDFRKQMAGVVAKAENGDLTGAGKDLSRAVAAGGYHFDLPYLTKVLSDNDKPVPPALVKADAVAKGIPYWTLEALVRLGQADAAKQAARQQTDPENKYRALCLVAVAQAGRYLNTPYMLPPVVEEKPDEWITKTDVPSDRPGMVKTLQVTSLSGPMVAPLLDCRSLEKPGAKDDTGAFATLNEALDALQPTKEIWLYRELSEIQGKMGDKAGSLRTVQASAALAAAQWDTLRQDKEKREVARQQIEMIATDLDALGDKPTAEKLRKMLSANAFQQVGLPLFITINVGALIIGLMMKRANRPTSLHLSGKA